MDKIRIDKYKHAIDIHIGRLGFEIGWFAGNDPCPVKVGLFEWMSCPKTLYILKIDIFLFSITIWVDLD